jgi:signal transduction histidine kinase
LIPKTRIIVFDTERNDRALLGLALKSIRSDLEVLEASNPLEVVHHLSAGPIAALVAEPGASFAELSAICDDVRGRDPACQFWLFTGEEDQPTPRDCVGRGVDGRAVKTSAGYLSLPGRLFERLRVAAELLERLTLEAGAVMSSVFPLAACLVGRHGHLVAVNREFEQLLQRPRYDLLDQPLDLLVNEPGRQEDIRRRLHGVREKWELAAPLRTGPGRQQTVAFTARPVGDAAGLVGYWAVSLMDVTRLLGSGEEGDQRQREGELDRLLFAVSHDLQAPLNSLASNARFLVEHLAQGDSETTGAVQEVAALTTRMQQMLDGILELSTLRSSVREPEVVDLDDVLADAIANLRSDIDDAGATIERQPLPSLLVNRQQMLQVFQNLIANALKFRSTRVPRIRVSSQETADSLRLLVEDNGIGIDPREHTRIFGMFQRLHGEREYPGLGIGLALCQQIVRGHGGELFVESTPGRGSCFIIEFRGPGMRSVVSRGNRNGAPQR